MSRLPRDGDALNSRRSAVEVVEPAAPSVEPVAPAAETSEALSATRADRRPYLRYGAGFAVLAVLLSGAIYFFFGHDDMPPPRQVRELTIVNIVRPPPPPPPPPPPEQKMIDQPKPTEQEFKEDKPLEKPKDEPAKEATNDQPPGPLSLDAKATGPGDLFNLGGKPGGNPYGPGGGGGSRWGAYAAMVQKEMTAALEANPKTKKAVVQGVKIRLWADSTGRITKVQLENSTGDAEVDNAIRNEVFGGLTLREPPPKDMPMPVVTRVTERRPS